MFDFYNDILVYDDDTSAGYDSKEVYIKPASVFFEQVPEATTADKLIRSVYKASVENSSGDGKSMSILLGYVKNGELTLFSGDQSHINIELDNDDKMVVFSNH